MSKSIAIEYGVETGPAAVVAGARKIAIEPQVKATLGLFGATANAMALIAPGGRSCGLHISSRPPLLPQAGLRLQAISGQE